MRVRNTLSWHEIQAQFKKKWLAASLVLTQPEVVVLGLAVLEHGQDLDVLVGQRDLGEEPDFPFERVEHRPHGQQDHVEEEQHRHGQPQLPGDDLGLEEIE